MVVCGMESEQNTIMRMICFSIFFLLGSFQNWREFKIKARRNSWAMEHRNQFPVPPESEEDDVDTA